MVSLRHGRWGKAIRVPGLNEGGSWVFSVSCGLAGDCAAGGYYGAQGFVASERDGVWGKAIVVPGLAALNEGDQAAVLSVSCGSAGNCAAGGYYDDHAGHGQGFLDGRRQGVWGAAFEVPGLAALNAGGSAMVSSVSCPPAGNCAAGGGYWDRHRHDQGFVVS